MNGSLFFVATIVAIVMCASVLKTYLKQHPKNPKSEEELADTLEKLAGLEERIQVLERIITENRYDLKKDIDSL